MSQRVLVIEDDALIRDLVDMLLEQVGYRVATTGVGRGAADLVARFRPHLVLLDIQLPDTDGLKVLTSIRAHGHTMPVLMMTADSRPQTVRDVMAMGGTGYLLKPFEPDGLVARVRSALNPASSTGLYTDI